MADVKGKQLPFQKLTLVKVIFSRFTSLLPSLSLSLLIISLVKGKTGSTKRHLENLIVVLVMGAPL